MEAKEEGAGAPYEEASWASRVTWWWMNPLVRRGQRAAALQVPDVPALAPSEGPEATHQLFCAQWADDPSLERGGGGGVRRALLRAFWPLLLLNALLALLRAAAVFTGPLLIQSFVKLKSTSSDGGNHPWEGLRLVLALLVSMAANALFSSHYTFHCARLGTKIRGALLTALYRKGLRLSCSARKKHAGVVVNYVAVDTQQVCDLMPLIHYLWVMPLQVRTSGLLARSQRP
jgi:ATP-binding cassette subfamily C (CFTR/MRP) protein 1